MRSIFRKTLSIIWLLITTIFGLLLLSGTPYLFKGFKFDFKGYTAYLINLTTNVFHNPLKITFSTGPGTVRELFPYILNPYYESFLLFIIALSCSIFLSIFISFFIAGLNKKYIDKILELLTYIQSIPEIFYIVSFQIIVIWIFKKTNIVIFNFASYGETRALFLPALALCITPTMILSRLMITGIKDEMDQDYFQYARAKGMSFSYILIVHIFRNTIYSLFHYSKTIILFMLTNLLVVEYLFNTRGIMMFILKYPFPEVFFFSMVLIFLPLLIMFSLIKLVIPIQVKGGNAL